MKIKQWWNQKDDREQISFISGMIVLISGISVILFVIPQIR